MVVDLLPDETDLVFAALADRTRRDIVHRVLVERHSVSALARHYDMSFAAVQKHVTVLERAGLVDKTRRGREVLVAADIETIRRAGALLADYERLWRGRVDRMDALLADPP